MTNSCPIHVFFEHTELLRATFDGRVQVVQSKNAVLDVGGTKQYSVVLDELNRLKKPD